MYTLKDIIIIIIIIITNYIKYIVSALNIVSA